MTFDILKAIILGIVEGLTEFVPVSSTGHLLLVQRFFGFADEDFGKTFAVLIQFGAILALLSIYFVRLWKLALGFFTDPAARRFVIGILLAFLPAAVVGAIAHDFIKSVLFNEWLICFTLIAGGAVLLWIDMLDLQPRYLFGCDGSESGIFERGARSSLPYGFSERLLRVDKADASPEFRVLPEGDECAGRLRKIAIVNIHLPRAVRQRGFNRTTRDPQEASFVGC